MTAAATIIELAATAGTQLEAELAEATDAGALAEMLNQLAGFYEGQDREPSYAFEPPAAARLRAELSKREGAARVELLNRLLLLYMLSRLDRTMIEDTVPSSVRPLLAELLANVLKAAGRRQSGVHTLAQDRYRKNLAIARLRLLPVGPELAELNGGIPRRVLFGPPWTTLASRAKFALTRLGAPRPLLVLHLDRRLAKHFSPGGYMESYCRLRDLLRMHPQTKGVWSDFAWYLDPALAEISPELAYLRNVPLTAGAFSIRGFPSERVTLDATRLSPDRQRLYSEGRYLPTPYGWVWPRVDLLGFTPPND